MIWSKDSQKYDPLADKNTCYLNSLKFYLCMQ